MSSRFAFRRDDTRRLYNGRTRDDCLRRAGIDPTAVLLTDIVQPAGSMARGSMVYSLNDRKCLGMLVEYTGR